MEFHDYMLRPPDQTREQQQSSGQLGLRRAKACRKLCAKDGDIRAKPVSAITKNVPRACGTAALKLREAPCDVWLAGSCRRRRPRSKIRSGGNGGFLRLFGRNRVRWTGGLGENCCHADWGDYHGSGDAP